MTPAQPLRRFFKRVVPLGVRVAMRGLQSEIAVWRIHRRSLRRARSLKLPSDLKLNIGCGSNLKDGWINIDLRDGSDLQLDLREPIPFENESVSVVYSEHFFEHLNYPDESLYFLREAYRVLKPSGLLSTGVPDAQELLKAYVNGDRDYLRKVDPWQPDWCDTPMHRVNFVFRQGGEHKYAYDFETLKQVLTQAGFVDVERRPFREGLDNEARRLGTLYVDARKPAS